MLTRKEARKSPYASRPPKPFTKSDLRRAVLAKYDGLAKAAVLVPSDEQVLAVTADIDYLSNLANIRVVTGEYGRVAIQAGGESWYSLGATAYASKSRSLGFLIEAEIEGIQYYQLEATLDERTSEICQHLHGMTFEVTTGLEKIVQSIEADDPDAAKAIQPWPSLKGLADMSEEDLEAQGIMLPPFHPNCRTIVVELGQATDVVSERFIEEPTEDEGFGFLSSLTHWLIQDLFKYDPDQPRDERGRWANAFSPSVRAARDLAIEAHRGQKYAGTEDYFKAHLSKVVESVAALPNATEEMIQVAYLHDSMEDTFVTPATLRERGLSPAVVEAVTAMTRDKENEDYFTYVRRAGSNPISRAVKIEDLKMNLASSLRPDRGKPSLAARYITALTMLGEADYLKHLGLIQKYDPYQPRDDLGRWTDEGISGGIRSGGLGVYDDDEDGWEVLWGRSSFKSSANVTEYRKQLRRLSDFEVDEILVDAKTAIRANPSFEKNQYYTQVQRLAEDELRSRGIAKYDPSQPRDERGRWTDAYAAQTETEPFKNWFKSSKVVDSDGKPLVVYHGTAASFDEFEIDNASGPQAAQEGGLFFATTPELASSFAQLAAEGGGGADDWEPGDRIQAGNVMPVYLSIQNPKVVDIMDVMTERGDFDELTNDPNKMRAVIRAAKKEGYDGLHITDYLETGRDEHGNRKYFREPQWVAFRPEQIKSAIGNRGTFDPNSKDITKYDPAQPREPKGSPTGGQWTPAMATAYENDYDETEGFGTTDQQELVENQMAADAAFAALHSAKEERGVASTLVELEANMKEYLYFYDAPARLAETARREVEERKGLFGDPTQTVMGDPSLLFNKQDLELAENFPQLSDVDVAVVRQYTEAGYLDLNRALFTNETKNAHLNVRDTMNRALDKFPVYEGTVYRGMGFGSDAERDDFVAKFQGPGTVHEFPAFTSSSTTVKGGEYFQSYDSGLSIVVESKSGRYVRTMARDFNENEVIFKAGTKFRLERIEYIGRPKIGGRMDQVPVLFMTEVEEPITKYDPNQPRVPKGNPEGGQFAQKFTAENWSDPANPFRHLEPPEPTTIGYRKVLDSPNDLSANLKEIIPFADSTAWYAGMARKNLEERVARDARAREHGSSFLTEEDMKVKESVEKMTDVEVAVIRSYLETGYEPINNALHTNRANNAHLNIRDTMNAALDKLPIYEGTVYRGIEFSKTAQESFMEPFVKGGDGSVHEFPMFTSTSTTVKGAEMFKGNSNFSVSMVFQSKTGRLARTMAMAYDESEVLFKAGTKFRLDTIRYNTLVRGEWTLKTPVLFFTEV